VCVLRERGVGVCVCVCLNVCVYMCMCACVDVCVHVCVCVCGGGKRGVGMRIISGRVNISKEQENMQD
jgi:hypothetical protein